MNLADQLRGERVQQSSAGDDQIPDGYWISAKSRALPDSGRCKVLLRAEAKTRS